MKLKKHINIALGYFLIIAFLGALLRLFYVVNIPFNYKHIVHAHSHIALLGWIYIALTTLIFYCYLKDNNVDKKYTTLFWCTQITLLGMLISFPITGYALVSIIFSSLFLLVSYWFFWFVTKHTYDKQKSSNSYKLIRTGLWFMVVSSIGPWALGIIMNTLGNNSIWYKNAIYFYLHFQYNGWFIVTLFGLFFFVLEKQNIHISKKKFNQFYWLLITSVVLTFFISILWTKPHVIFNFIGGFGSILQLIAFTFLIHLIKPFSKKLKSTISPFLLGMTKVVILFLTLKMILQLLGSIFYFSTVIANHIEFAIGYLHWNFLGIVSVSLFGLLHYFNLIRLPKTGYKFYLIGFVLTEILIFYKGFVHWFKLSLFEHYYTLLAIVSFTLFLGVLIIFSKQFKKLTA